MRILTLIALLLGLGIAGAVAFSAGLAEIKAALLASGWAVVAVIATRIVVVSVAGLGWWRLFPADCRPGLMLAVNIRFIREGINMLLPVAAVGGDVIGARLLALFGHPGAVAAASVVADLFVQVVTQALFTLAGLAVLLTLGVGGAIATTAGIGLALAVPALGGFYLVQRRGAGDLILKALRKLAGDRALAAMGATDAFYHALERMHRDRRGLAASAAIHLAGWLAGAVEIYAGLMLMGHPVGFAEAFVIESLMQAARGAAFAVPGAIGVQEGGLVVLCAAFGVPAETAIALSLIKRAADLILGVPGLIAWQVIEGRRVLRRNDAS